MTSSIRRHVAVGTLAAVLGAAALVAALTAPPRNAQAQPGQLLAQQPPASCVCAPAVPVFSVGGGPQIAHCQCGALHCAAATAAGGVALQCAR